MPLAYEKLIKVRHYECDANGLVQHANLLRYMEETAFEASASVGYGLDKFDRMGCYWLARETELTLIRPLSYGESFTLTTWVADMKGVRSRRMYQLQPADKIGVIATAYTDWAFIDKNSGQPVRIPDDMAAAYFEKGIPQTAPKRERTIWPEPPAEGCYRQQRRVEWREIDAARHVNNAVYLAYVQECWRRMLRQSQPEAASELLIPWQPDGYHITYLHQALLDDELELTAWPEDGDNGHEKLHAVVTRQADGEMLARAWSVGRRYAAPLSPETGNL
jgi:acyl-CoA thioester hydrolase